MKLIYNKLIPFKGYAAITICEWIFINKNSKFNSSIFNHEAIHVLQTRECLYIMFYVWYVIEYLIKLVITRNHKTAYRSVSFEQEAYDNQSKPFYRTGRSHYSWLKYLFKLHKD